MKRRICYISGTRADFGLMQRTLSRIRENPELDLQVAVTGMHLSPAHGGTVRDIEATGLSICGRIPVTLSPTSGATMARAIADELAGFVDIFTREKPDLVLVLGDRGEMLAGTLAAVHLNIPVTHIHGGERSGTVDEPVRHAISKLAHYHFVATAGSRERLIRMGEQPASIFVTGAPGLDGLPTLAATPRAELGKQQGLVSTQPIVLVVFHSVVQNATLAAHEMETVLEGVLATGAQVLCFMPNSDAGGSAIRDVIEHYAGKATIQAVAHFARDTYLSWLAAADALVGNSSSGIIEAASFGLPVVNVGDRQHDRERNANTCDVPVDAAAIHRATDAAIAGGRQKIANLYGDGRAGERIADLLSSLPLTQSLLHKRNAY